MAQLSDDCFAFGGELMTTHAALIELRERLSCICKTEDVVLEKALGRIVAENVVSTTDVPAYDNAAVDGYAIYFDDISQTSNTQLPINGRVTAGHPLRKVAETGNAYRIFTGAPMPKKERVLLFQRV